jgi:hypothetical protein
MKTALLALALAGLAPSASAGKYVLHNGRAVSGGGGNGGAESRAVPRGGGDRASGAGVRSMAEPASGEGIAGRRASGGHQSFWGAGARLGRNIYRVPQKVMGAPGGTAGTGGGSGGSGGTGGSGDDPPDVPPSYSKPGALVRTEGHRPFEYAQTGDARTTGPAAGEIVLEPRKAHDVGRAPGVRMGPRDTPPPCTPGNAGCGSSGGSSVTPNLASSAGSGGGASLGSASDAGSAGGTGFDPSF